MPHKLLLADDSVTIQRVIELTFADEPVQVVAVSDGDQAIARIDADPPDIVLADVGMPGKNGYEVAAHVKQTPALAHIPVLLLTGAFEPVDQARVTAIGCDGVLAKPFEPQQVIGRVHELLAGAREQAAPEAPAVTARPTAAPVSAGPAPEPAHDGAGPQQKLDDYFDRLDAAFATMSFGEGRRAKPEGDSAPVPPTGTSLADQIDWFANHGGEGPAPAAPDLPLSYGSPQSAFAVPPAAPSAPPAVPPVPAAATTAPVPPLPPFVPIPSLADAFAVLLASEQRVGGNPAAVWPTTPATGDLPEPVIDQVVSRVLAELSDTVVRQAVADLVSQTAERLVREEIDRIKASVQ